MILIDTHCHLNHDPLADRLDPVLLRATAASVHQIIIPSYDTPSWSAVATLATRENIFPAFGLHPWEAHTVTPGELIHALGAQVSFPPGPVAIGEIGLDTKLPPGGPDLDTQLAVLRPQLDLADDLDLPVILHCRGAFEILLDELTRFEGRLRGVVHAWSRGPELAERFTAMGLALGIGGAVTRPTARRVRRTVQHLPLESFILETDAPSIGLDGVPPEETEPAHVADIASAVAELRGESIDTVAEVTTAHAQRLFKLPT
ncbi:TatD family deoxyribonuclease [bacterium]|nr:MAG: TatD family deoxyribonuclease [bacterium]